MTERLDYVRVAATGMKAFGVVHTYIAQRGLPNMRLPCGNVAVQRQGNLRSDHRHRIDERLQPAGGRLSHDASRRDPRRLNEVLLCRYSKST
jgi:hypothetical protein